jgi:hypothetical protein
MGSQPTPAPTATNDKVKVKEPTPFDGSYSKYRSWLRDLTIFLAAYRITDDRQKVLVALSYLSGGYTEDFKNEEYNRAVHADPDDPDWGTWQDFKRRLDDRFKHKYFAKEAREKLEKCSQGKQRIDEYFTTLDALFDDAGMTDDSEKIRILERGLNENILEVIYGTGTPIPVGYNNYKNRATSVGRLKETLSQLRHQPHTPPSHPPPKPKPQQQPVVFQTHVHSPETKRPIPGAGTPMEIDRTKSRVVCFNCNKPGHYRKDCPEPRTALNVRSIIESLDEGEIDALLFELTKTDHEKDFLEGR